MLPERGAALMTVLWLLALLAILATTVTALSVSVRRESQHYGEAVQAQEALDSAIRLTLLPWMANPNAEGTQPATADQMVADVSIRVTIENEAGRIDLNNAPMDLLAAYFREVGADDARAQLMAERITEWRELSTQSEFAGKEANQFDATGSLPKHHGPLQTVGEVRRVLWDHSMDDRVIDGLTVYTHQPEPSVDACVPIVCKALGQLKQQGSLPRETSERAQSSLTDSNVMQIRTRLIGEAIRVTACAADDRDTPCRQLIARLTGNRARPLQVFEWESIFALGKRSQ